MYRCGRRNWRHDRRAQFRSWRKRIVPSGWRLKNFLQEEGEEAAWSHCHRRQLQRPLQGAPNRKSSASQSTCRLRFLDSSALRTCSGKPKRRAVDRTHGQRLSTLLNNAREKHAALSVRDVLAGNLHAAAFGEREPIELEKSRIPQMNFNGSGRGLHGDVRAKRRHRRVLRIFQDGSFEKHVAIRVVCGCARFSGLLRPLPHLLGAGNNREKKRASKKDTARSHENDWFHIPFPPARVPLRTLVRRGGQTVSRPSGFISLDAESPSGGF